MKTITRDVKSRGAVVDTVTLKIPENLKEAIADAKGEQGVLDAYVKTITDGAMNAARAAKVRPASAQAILSKLAKEDPAVKAKIDKLLADIQAGKK